MNSCENDCKDSVDAADNNVGNSKCWILAAEPAGLGDNKSFGAAELSYRVGLKESEKVSK